ncbi:hypothetical protein T03_16751 [Trichinella britovi]|uniref:Uncharacterized protein n=1 Tax=Trichinella britovi TaxID=45882 RepID=A0A0V1DIS5_TRIBR|nr:hypothetical protein T03_16751 [Trichinella britovi]
MNIKLCELVRLRFISKRFVKLLSYIYNIYKNKKISMTIKEITSHHNLDKCLLIRGYLQSVSINRFCYFPWKHGPKSICAEFVQATQLVCSRLIINSSLRQHPAATTSLIRLNT